MTDAHSVKTIARTFARHLLRLTLAAALAAALAAGAWPLALSAQTTQRFEGNLDVVWGDPHPTLGLTGETRYALTLTDGTILPLQLQQGVPRQLFGKRVIVSGRVFADQTNVQNQTLVVESMVLSPEAMLDQTTAVLGTKKVIFLLVKFSDDTNVPHPPSFYTNMTNPDTPPPGEVFPTTINGFFRKTSWNQFSWIGDVGGAGGVGAPGGWLTLPNPKSFYANCNFSTSCANLTTLATDATALGRAQGIDFKVYDNINFVLSNDLDCCAWGGGFFSSVDNKSYGATWEPPWGQNTTTYAHEMGHSIGLPHSGWVYFAYDSPWDVMSTAQVVTSVNCGSYFSRNNNANASLFCSEPGAGFLTAYKDQLGWIPPANQVVTSTFGSTTVTLEGATLPLGAGIKTIKICLKTYVCSGSGARYLSVEARVKALGATSQFDNAIPFEGVVIHDIWLSRPAISGTCFFNNQSGWGVTIDSTPGDYNSASCNSGGRSFPNYALYNAHWTPGQTYSNATYGVNVAVISRSGSNFVVRVSSTTNIPVPPGDFSGDGRSDVTVFRPSTGIWYVRNIVTGLYEFYQWGLSGDVPAPRDYDGDSKVDAAVWRPSTGIWYIRNSSDGSLAFLQWGLNGDIPVSGDYDGDGKADAAVFRPSTGIWYVRDLVTNTAFFYQWGLDGDIPVPADYDGDGRTDVAVWRPSTGIWYIRQSSNGGQAFLQWGLTGDIPAPGDYDGDGKADAAVFRPSTGMYYVRDLVTNTALFYQWGLNGDVPVPGDYDGDGKTDLAVFRPSTSIWYVRNSSNAAGAFYQWGIAGDIPVLKGN